MQSELKKRNLLIVILLFYCTFGIYAVYLFVAFGFEVYKESINKNTNTELRTPITAFILSLLTFGIYGLYYIYKQAEVLNELGRKYGCSTLNPFIILLLTLLLGVGALLNVYSASNLSNISENT